MSSGVQERSLGEQTSRRQRRLQPRKEATSTSFYELARRRSRTVWWVAAPLSAAHIPLGFLDAQFSWPLLISELLLVAMELVIWRVCATPRLGALAALRWSMLLGIPHAWLVSLIVHSAPGARVDQFSIVLLQALLLTLIVPLRLRFIAPVLVAMCASQPVVAAWALHAGFAQGDSTDLMLSGLGALFTVGLSLAAVHLMRKNRAQVERELGGYTLERQIARGGMGEIWEGRHRFLARPAAIKLLALNESSPDFVERFRREAEATALLDSEHTVHLYDYGVSASGSPYYVMELLRGQDLQRWVEARGPLSPQLAVHLLRQACESLAEAHAAGLIHRDVKPSNLFIVSRGRDPHFLKVLDFGLVSVQAATQRTHADSTLTQDGALTGTPAYLPPEYCLDLPIDARSDIYQLGCVLFYLLTGEVVFPHRSPLQLALAHGSATPRLVSSLRPVPARLDLVVRRCLAKRPEDRPASAQALDLELAALQQTEGWAQQRGVAWGSGDALVWGSAAGSGTSAGKQRAPSE